MSGGPRPQVLPRAPEIITFPNKETAGTVIIVNRRCKLYYTLSPTEAYEYPISIGRLGFTWTGTEKISRMVDWPDWIPPREMLQRQPGLPRKMTGGLNNPLGVRALYLGASLYRIHGTNNTRTIGHAASSGCFRMMNEHVMHLSGFAHIGTKVRVVENWPLAGVVGVRQGAQQVCGAEIPVDQRQRQPVAREGRGLGLLGVFAPWRW
jgi:lipoprotein-anchoring transpeptidase ErfK/SrfK